MENNHLQVNSSRNLLTNYEIMSKMLAVWLGTIGTTLQTKTAPPNVKKLNWSNCTTKILTFNWYQCHLFYSKNKSLYGWSILKSKYTVYSTHYTPYIREYALNMLLKILSKMIDFKWQLQQNSTRFCCLYLYRRLDFLSCNPSHLSREGVSWNISASPSGKSIWTKSGIVSSLCIVMTANFSRLLHAYASFSQVPEYGHYRYPKFHVLEIMYFQYLEHNIE